MTLPGITFLGHATVLIELGGLRILTDPILVDRLLFLTRIVRPVDTVHVEEVDLVLISHLHIDHFDRLSLRRLMSLTEAHGQPELIVCPGAEGLARKWGWTQVTELAPGQSRTVGEVLITATPATHAGSRPPFGPNGTAVGFLIESGEAKVYFAGDTDLFPEMSTMVNGELDIALLPIAGWGPRLGKGHMNPKRAVEATIRLKPRYVVPIHWGTLWPYGLGRMSHGQLEGIPKQVVKAYEERKDEITAQPLIALPGERVPFVP